MSSISSTLNTLGIGPASGKSKTAETTKRRLQRPSNNTPSNLLPVPAFDVNLLPNALCPWVADIAERMQCPVDFLAVGEMVALAGVVGRQIGIRPKRRDDWMVVPNLWGGMVARPGFLKSPALREVMRPLKRLEARAAAEHAEARTAVQRRCNGWGGTEKTGASRNRKGRQTRRQRPAQTSIRSSC